MKGIVTGIHRCALDDGPGIRTAVFLKGCALQCGWCHNPETQNLQPELMAYPERCVGCERCATACRLGLWNTAPKSGGHDRTLCTGCGECAAVCPNGALVIAGEWMTSDEVMANVILDKSFYDDTGGGMTLTGGDPLIQWQFSLALLKKAKNAGLHTCVETSGAGDAAAVKNLIPFVDLWLFDMKGQPEDYPKYTGSPFAPIEKNLELLRQIGARVILRCPQIPGICDRDGYALHLESLKARWGDSPEVEVQFLPYHTYGTDKYAALNRKPFTV